jgi:hypothetical protein
MTREGLPTIRIRTADGDGNLTGEVILDPDACRLVAANLEIPLEQLGKVIDPAGGVHHGGATRFGTEDGWIEIAWTVSGEFSGPLGSR